MAVGWLVELEYYCLDEEAKLKDLPTITHILISII